jgi:hypothetical protein
MFVGRWMTSKTHDMSSTAYWHDWNGALDDDRDNNDQHMLASSMGEYDGDIWTLVPCAKAIPKVSRFCRRGQGASYLGNVIFTQG